MNREQTARACLEQIRRRIPEALAFVEALGEKTLGELSRAPFPTVSPLRAPIQDGNDLIALARKMASGPLGPEQGRKLALALEKDFRALTANHLGPDFHPEFAQGNLVFALKALREKAPAIPVFAWGCMPGNSFGYPRGLLLGRGREQSARPGRFPALPDKHRHIPLSLREAFAPEPVRATLARPTLVSPDCGPLTPAESRAARRLLAEVFCHPRVLGQKTYADQVTVMNKLLWELIFAPDCRPLPPLITLDMTLLGLEVIRADLHDPHSLIRCLLEPDMPRALLEELNEVMGCWNLDQEQKQSLLSGSFLFWDIDREKNFRPLFPDAACAQLLSADGSIRVSLEARELEAALAERLILPGLFLSFSALALARGLLCRGGVYQIRYLEDMRRGLVRALRRRGENALAEKLEPGPPGAMIGGFIPLRCRGDDPENPPSWAASPVDMLARGGLDSGLPERLAALPCRAAFAATLAFHYEELVPPAERLPGWFSALEDDSGAALFL